MKIKSTTAIDPKNRFKPNVHKINKNQNATTIRAKSLISFVTFLTLNS